MALKPCRECRKKVSTEADTCPSCGVPDPTTKAKKHQPREESSIFEGMFSGYASEGTSKSYKSKIKKKDRENFSLEKNDYKKSQVNSKIDNIFSDVWEGKLTLAKTFWTYFVLLNFVITFIVGFVSAAMGVGRWIIIIPLVYNVWAAVGVWNSATKYKNQKIKQRRSYGYATAAQVYIIFNIIVGLSQLGFYLQ